MKRSLILISLVIAMLLLTATAGAAYEPQSVKPDGIEVVSYLYDFDYMKHMIKCAEVGTKETMRLGAIYEEQRNLKIDRLDLDTEKTYFFDTFNAKKVLSEINEYRRSNYIMYYTEEDIINIAKVMYSECRGVKSVTEQACVAWTILNRVDDKPGATIYEVITNPGAFVFLKSAPVWDNLYDLAEDVLQRWNAEKNGETDVGRVLPKEYRYFGSYKGGNRFRDKFSGDVNYWDYSLPSPYEN